jgi:predicted nucleic acid binding AN1-type Zn finger protein
VEIKQKIENFLAKIFRKEKNSINYKDEKNPPYKKEKAVEYLIDNIPENTIKDIKKLMRKNGSDWWVEQHYGYGMVVKNLLRQSGYCSDILQLNNVWVGCVEEAVKRKFDSKKIEEYPDNVEVITNNENGTIEGRYIDYDFMMKDTEESKFQRQQEAAKIIDKNIEIPGPDTSKSNNSSISDKTDFPELYRTSNYPLFENCLICGDTVYLPFHCEYCDQFFCNNHHLPFNHNCENIEEYNKKSPSEGTAIESKGGKLFVWK